MLALARAWLRKPTIVCIDEPSMGLSRAMSIKYTTCCRRGRRKGRRSFLWSRTHAWLWNSPTGPTSFSTAVSPSPGPAAKLASDPQVRQAYLGAAEPSVAGSSILGLAGRSFFLGRRGRTHKRFRPVARRSGSRAEAGPGGRARCFPRTPAEQPAFCSSGNDEIDEVVQALGQ